MDYFLALKTRPNNPVDIVATNNSWGGGPFSQALLDAIAAHRQAGMLFVAAGNNGSNNDSFPFYPASYELDNIISVLAHNRFNQLSFFSNYGALTVDVGAPGEDVFSTLPGNSYGTLSGTSMATPHVTGLVGLVFALAVTDSDGLTDTAQVTIPIAPLPVANAAASDAVVSQGATVTLDGSQSVGAVSYSWKQLAGASASLSNASAASPTFVAPGRRAGTTS